MQDEIAGFILCAAFFVAGFFTGWIAFHEPNKVYDIHLTIDNPTAQSLIQGHR